MSTITSRPKTLRRRTVGTPSEWTWREPRFTGPKAFSPVTFLVALVPLTVGSVVIDGLPRGATPPIAWYAALAALVVAAAVFMIAGKVANRVCPGPSLPRTISVLAVYAVAEVLRTLSVGIILQRYGLSFEMMIHHRIVSGALTGMLVLGLVSIVVNDRARYVADFEVLAERSRDLERELFLLTNNIDLFLDNLRETIRQTVDASLAPIIEKYRTQYSVSEVVNDIVDVSEYVVRPLSVEIADAIPDSTDSPESVPTFSLPRLFYLTTTVKPFQPGVISLVMFLLLFGGSVFTVPLPAGLIMLMVMIGATAGVHWLANRYIHPRLPSWNAITRVVVISSVFAPGPLLPMIAVVFFFERGFSSSRMLFLFYMLLVLEFVSWVLATIPAVRRGQEDVLGRLVETTSELGQVRSRAEVRLRKEKQRLAAIVHGDIQSTLMATALKLQHPDTREEDVDRLITAARDQIGEMLRDMAEGDNHRTLDKVMTGLGDAWDGIVSLTWSVDNEVHDLVARDDDLGETLWQVLREATTNSVKHGRASAVAIWLRVDPETAYLMCSVSDDGQSDRTSTHRGGGSRLFSAVADSHQRTREGNQTTLTLHIPLPLDLQAFPIPS